MSIDLGATNTTRYLTPGNGVDVLSTRPISLVAMVHSRNMDYASYRGVFTQGGASVNRGWSLLFPSYSAMVLVKNTTVTEAPIAPTSNTGWWLVMVVIREAPSDRCDFYIYRYSTGALTSSRSRAGSNADPTPPGASDPTVIAGAWDGSLQSHWKGPYSWVAVYNFDIGSAGQVSTPWIYELINHGPWRRMVPKCRMFVPLHSTYQLKDQSGFRRNLTMVNTPWSWAPPSPTELPPWSPLPLPLRHTETVAAATSMPPMYTGLSQAILAR